MRAHKKLSSPDIFQVLESRFQGKVRVVGTGETNRTREIASKRTSMDIIDMVISFLNITEISLLGGVNRFFNRECQHSRHYECLDFAIVPIPLTQSLIISKVGFAHDHLKKLVLPSYLRHSDYKKYAHVNLVSF